MTDLNAQDRKTAIGLEFQAYPTGLIPGIRVDRTLGVKSAAHLRVGYNWVRHGDAGVHEDERGEGFGATLGYRRFFKAGPKSFFAGIRCDLWSNQLEWKDQIGQADEVSGISKILVLQPTLEGGYLFASESGCYVSPSLAFGREINIKTEGEKVGEGFILLIGISAGKQF